MISQTSRAVGIDRPKLMSTPTVRILRSRNKVTRACITTARAHQLHFFRRCSPDGIRHRELVAPVRASAELELGGLAMSVVGRFTPAHAALGGLLIGIATTAQLLLNGRVLGVSGVVKGMINGQPGGGRLEVLSGMLLTAVLMGQVMPASFTPLPETYTLTRALVGGLLVGLGSSMGNGCTSGHGICGQARLSPRSFGYTVLFMSVGAVTAFMTGAAEAAGIVTSEVAKLLLPGPEVLTLALGIAGIASVAFVGLGLIASKQQKPLPPVVESVASFGIGSAFAAGLTVSGMTLPAKVIMFLMPTVPAWDATLAFIMAFALVISMIAYQSVLGRLPFLPQQFRAPASSGGRGTGSPVLTNAYSLPTSSAIDGRLILGGILFGAGWGASGICPGPALVGLFGAASHTLLLGGAIGDCLCRWLAVYVAAMMAGFLLEPRLSKAESG